MVQNQSKKTQSEPLPEHSGRPLPAGYRQGIITSITVVLGFSLLFLRYWGFEVPGRWSVASIIAAILLILAIVLEFVALWRSLRVIDDEVTEYNQTLRWFFLSVIILLISLLIAELAYTHVAGL